MAGDRSPHRPPRRRAGSRPRSRLLLHTRPLYARRRPAFLETWLLGPAPAGLGLGPRAWVRRPAGWEFRAGHWVRDADAADSSVNISRRTTARPVPPGSAPEAVEPELEPLSPDRDTDRPPPPPGVESELDPIAEAEQADRARGDLPRVVIVPPGRMPLYVIRPPGSYPYGPAGVVVPGAVPPFVRRLLDQVLTMRITSGNDR